MAVVHRTSSPHLGVSWLVMQVQTSDDRDHMPRASLADGTVEAGSCIQGGYRKIGAMGDRIRRGSDISVVLPHSYPVGIEDRDNRASRANAPGDTLFG